MASLVEITSFNCYEEYSDPVLSRYCGLQIQTKLAFGTLVSWALQFFYQHLKIWQDTILQVIAILLKDGGDPPVKRTSEYQKPTTRKNGRNSFTPFQENQGP